MHPILAARRRFLLYLAAWAPLAGLLSVVTAASGAASLREAASALAPACAAYAFVCLSPWYVCRVRPLTLAGAPGLTLTFGAAATVAGALFGGAVRLAALGLSASGWTGVDKRLQSATALLVGMGALLYLLSAGLHYAVIASAASLEAERREAEARNLANEAELRVLRIQLNPHFLFNSLHSISALATVDGVRAREMCIRLGSFLRSSLGLGHSAEIPLADEIALARSYLGVEQVRFGERLRLKEEIEPECLACTIPALLLQPLIENAVKHGIAGLVEGGLVRIAVGREGGAVSVTIDNPFDPEMPMPRGTGLGIAHVRRRLEIRYGGAAVLSAGPHEGVYRVELRFPCESPMASSSRA